jgi:hypothetical protein
LQLEEHQGGKGERSSSASAKENKGVKVGLAAGDASPLPNTTPFSSITPQAFGMPFLPPSFISNGQLRHPHGLPATFPFFNPFFDR